ncbi:GldM family protein [Hymenobacter sp. HD11105]
MKTMLLVLALLSGRWASAQTTCPPPQLKAFHNEQQIKTAGSAFSPDITLTLVSDPACATAASYQVKEAEMTLIRGSRPVLPARAYQGAAIDLTDFGKHAQPGDRLNIRVLKVVRTSVGGQPRIIRPTEANPIALNWVLTR